MLYKLFKNEENRILIDMSYDKQDIVDALEERINKETDIDYSVIKNQDGKDVEISRIISVEGFIKFKHIGRTLTLKK